MRVFHKEVEYLIEGFNGKNRTPFAQGIFARLGKDRFAQGVIQILADKIHQLRLPADFVHHHPVQLQAAPVDDDMSHSRKEDTRKSV